VPYELSIKAQDYLTKSNGSVIMIGSRFAIQVAGGTNPAYSIAKAAQHQLTRNLSVQLAPVRVNAVAPGMFESARWARKFAGREEARRVEFVNKSLSNSTVTAKSLVDAIVFLSLNEHVTGQILPVCAGTSVARV
jgi:NAD(P)-dependent dehydrogenase (short-subunit alcohol dehydrogenase family)